MERRADPSDGQRGREGERSLHGGGGSDRSSDVLSYLASERRSPSRGEEREDEPTGKPNRPQNLEIEMPVWICLVSVTLPELGYSDADAGSHNSHAFEPLWHRARSRRVFRKVREIALTFFFFFLHSSTRAGVEWDQPKVV